MTFWGQGTAKSYRPLKNYVGYRTAPWISLWAPNIGPVFCYVRHSHRCDTEYSMWAEQKTERRGPKSQMSGEERLAGVGKNERSAERGVAEWVRSGERKSQKRALTRSGKTVRSAPLHSAPLTHTGSSYLNSAFLFHVKWGNAVVLKCCRLTFNLNVYYLLFIVP